MGRFLGKYPVILSNKCLIFEKSCGKISVTITKGRGQE
jgi:hypothetical protein